MNFERAVKVVLDLESGYVFDSDDPGGETKFGISKKSYPYMVIRDLTIEDATLIYKRDFWDLMKIDDMPDPLRLLVFDMAVNSGVTRAIKMLQGAAGVTQDGVLGPLLFTALREVAAGATFQNIVMLRHAYYTQNLRWDKFGKGWSRRLLKVILESVDII